MFKHRRQVSLTSLFRKNTEEVLPRLLKDDYLRHINAAVKTVYHSDCRILGEGKEKKESKAKATIRLVDADTIDAAEEMCDRGLAPLILNMASSYKPGGGWHKGCLAQEEALFYRSTYCLSLDSWWKLDEKRTWSYPLDDYACVYSPDVVIFRHGSEYNWELRKKKECTALSFLAVAAIRRPAVLFSSSSSSSCLYAKDEDRKLMRDKIEGIFKAALEHKHETLVLGALGCGAYKNPPEEVARLFADALLKYQSCFKEITFAILDGNRTTNLKTFQTIFFEKGIQC